MTAKHKDAYMVYNRCDEAPPDEYDRDYAFAGADTWYSLRPGDAPWAQEWVCFQFTTTAQWYCVPALPPPLDAVDLEGGNCP
jgi:hypothetical protein